jgi:hypothetical protein
MEGIGRQEALAESEGEDPKLWLLSVIHCSVMLTATYAATFVGTSGRDSEEELKQMIARIFPSLQSAVQTEMDREPLRLGVGGDMAQKLKWMPRRPGHV